jgi:hypothetical protein
MMATCRAWSASNSKRASLTSSTSWSLAAFSFSGRFRMMWQIGPLGS